MDIKRIPIEQIHFAPYNPRVMEDAEYEKLKRSMITFGYVEPVVWNSETSNAVGGNQRLKAAIELGFKEIDVVVVKLSLVKEKALNIALNKISGRFDPEKLTLLLDELSKMPDFEFELTGFELPELSQLLDRYGETKEDDFDFDAALKSIKEPITKIGDLIQLGPHRVLCGDSSNPEDVKTLMGENKADHLNTDFPYNVDYGGGDKPNPNTRPKKSRNWSAIYSDNLPQPEYEAWMRKVLVLAKEYLRPGAAIYIWQGHRQFPPMYQILLELGFHVSCVLCWLKESIAISYADYCFRTEQCLYGWLEGAPHYWAGKPGESNVWEVKRDPTKTYVHPTQKPAMLAQRAIENSSKRGDIVLDLFLGSGSTLIGAESLSRRCYGCEIDPHYVDAIVRRYANYIGLDKISVDIKNKYFKES
jgi:DNA modification methylase